MFLFAGADDERDNNDYILDMLLGAIPLDNPFHRQEDLGWIPPDTEPMLRAKVIYNQWGVLELEELCTTLELYKPWESGEESDE